MRGLVDMSGLGRPICLASGLSRHAWLWAIIPRHCGSLTADNKEFYRFALYQASCLVYHGLHATHGTISNPLDPHSPYLHPSAHHNSKTLPFLPHYLMQPTAETGTMDPPSHLPPPTDTPPHSGYFSSITTTKTPAINHLFEKSLHTPSSSERK